MLIPFFYTLRDARLPVSVKEYLTLLEALRAGVIGPSIDGQAVARLRPDVVLLLMVERNLEMLLQPHVNLAAACAD